MASVGNKTLCEIDSSRMLPWQLELAAGVVERMNEPVEVGVAVKQAQHQR